MPKQNKLTFEGRVLGEVKSKTFSSGKTIHEWLMGVGAKQSDGTWKNALISVKKWGDTYPIKGQDIVVEGKLKAEMWGEGKSKILIECESFSIVGNDHNDHQDAHQQAKQNGYAPQPESDQLPF